MYVSKEIPPVKWNSCNEKEIRTLNAHKDRRLRTEGPFPVVSGPENTFVVVMLLAQDGARALVQGSLAAFDTSDI